jgi:diketogulonate reductase-like aldo/keto reductase
VRAVKLPDGEAVPVLGQGTSRMGEDPGRRGAEVAALRRGLDLGLALIDTAEVYGEGGAEEVVGEAIAGRRDEVFLVSKVRPRNALSRDAVAACERSLRRLGTDRLDLYLLHGRGPRPLAETVAVFERLRHEGKIRHWGVSNLHPDEMEELWGVPDGRRCATDQVPYNVSRRGIEWDLLPWCRERGISVMAYSPLEQGRLPTGGVLGEVGRRHGRSPFQVVLAWVLTRPGVVAIPKAARPEHVEANAKALELALTPEDLAAIDRSFPPPAGKQRKRANRYLRKLRKRLGALVMRLRQMVPWADASILAAGLGGTCM